MGNSLYNACEALAVQFKADYMLRTSRVSLSDIVGTPGKNDLNPVLPILSVSLLPLRGQIALIMRSMFTLICLSTKLVRR